MPNYILHAKLNNLNSVSSAIFFFWCRNDLYKYNLSFLLSVFINLEGKNNKMYACFSRKVDFILGLIAFASILITFWCICYSCDGQTDGGRMWVIDGWQRSLLEMLPHPKTAPLSDSVWRPSGVDSFFLISSALASLIPHFPKPKKDKNKIIWKFLLSKLY